METESQFIPLEQAGAEAWNRLAQAANDVYSPMRLITLANVDAAGNPNARLMVVRGADRDAGHLWLHTDRRSAKVGQLRRRPQVCAVAYDPRDRILVRLWGAATLHQRDALADDHWQQTLLSMRHAYGLPQEPAQQLPKADPRLNKLWSHQRTRKIAEDRSNFLVIQLAATKLEWLQVCGIAQRRAVLCAGNGWASTECQTCTIDLEEH